MSHDRSGRDNYMDADDFEELLADMPHDQGWEVIGGRVVRMVVGARWQHDIVIQGPAGALRRRFGARGSDRRRFSKTFFPKASWLKSATLPDIIVRCGRLADDATSLDDPKVLVSVMSPGSEGRDRVEKCKACRQTVSLEHDAVIERDHPAIDTCDPTEDAWAVRRTTEGLSSDPSLPAVNMSVPWHEIYGDVLSA